MQLPIGRLAHTSLLLLACPLVLLALTGSLTESPETRQRNNLAYASVAALKHQMPDTHGFKVEAMHVTDTGAACIRYHTRDAAGNLTDGQAVVVDKLVTQAGAGDERFTRAWNRQCLGAAHDVTYAVERFF
jgi:hypothetical protein